MTSPFGTAQQWEPKGRAPIGSNSAIAANFTNRPDGAPPSTDDNGNKVSLTVNNGNAAVVSSGKLVAQPTTDTGAYASYYQVPFAGGANGSRIGAEWTVASNDGGISSVCLALWDSVYASPFGLVPQARAHLVITPGASNWAFYVCDGSGNLALVTSGTFSAPAYDDTAIWRTEILVDEDEGDVYLWLPDDSIAKVLASQISSTISGTAGWSAGSNVAALSGKYAVVEHYADSNALTVEASFPKYLSIWAESAVLPHADRATNPLSVARAIVAGRSAASVPTFTHYAPGTTAVIAAPTVQAAVDETNAVITGTYGPTGSSLIDVTAYYEFTRGADSIYWQLFNGESGIDGSGAELAHVGGAGDSVYVHHEFFATNGTPGASFTFNLRHMSLSGNPDLKAGSAPPFAPLFIKAIPA